ncbi:hypothetical protein VTK26DRAFT_2401 [Humicola hyalothermophila]
MASAEETPIDTTSRVCQTESGYLWYICTWKHPYYSGCCRVDPCKQDPIGCPPSARGEPVGVTTHHSSTSSTTSQTASDSLLATEATATSLPTATTSSTPSPGAPAPPIISSTSTTDSDSGSDGVTLPVGTLVGIVVGCTLAALFAAVMACMWWGRRRREKEEKREQAERLASSGGLDEEHLPPGLDSVFNPMTEAGPGSVFDRGQGRMGKGESMLGFGSFGRDSHLSSGGHSVLISPLTPASTLGMGLGLPSSPSELDSTPVQGPQASAQIEPRPPAELDSHSIPPDEEISKPRATLGSTQHEREAGTYVNSWTRFQNVQL